MKWELLFEEKTQDAARQLEKKNMFRNNSNCAGPQGDYIFLKSCLNVRRDSVQIIIMERVLDKQDIEKSIPVAVQALY